MSILSKVNNGILEAPQVWLLHSAPGVGKTTLAGQFPNVIFADLEDGSKHLNVSRLSSKELPNYKALLDFIAELKSSKHTYKTLVIDSATVLESYIYNHLCGSKYETIEQYDGGFGKGYTAARKALQDLFPELRALQMDIIICAHSQVKPFTDPVTNSTYDRYIIQANAKFSEILTSQADNVFFLKHEVDTAVDAKTKKTQAFGSGKRVIMTTWHPAYEAKNRLNLQDEVELDYKALRKAIENAKPKTADELIADIKTLCLKAPADLAETAKAKVKEANGDVAALARIKAKVASQVVVA